MWKKLYSNSGLILLAVLAAGIWFNNLQPYFQPKNTTPIQPQAFAPAPTPRKSAEELLGIEPSPTPSQSRKYADFHEVVSPTPAPTLAPSFDVDEFMKRRRQGATAICRDGAYSYSANRRGTCSHHGGVAQWLSH